MKFSMSAAWNDATTLMQRNKDVMAIVAGVFFLLPGLVLAIVFAEQQAQAMAMMQSMLQGQILQGEPEAAALAVPNWFFAVSLAAFFVQLIGYLALLALMDDRRRPTVGEAISTAFKCLLPLIGAIVLFAVGYVACALVASLVLGVLIAAISAVSTTLAGLLTVILVIALFGGICWIMVRLSLVLPEMILGAKLNPVRAYLGSWRITKGNSFRIFLFYLLLVIVYIVVYAVIFGVLMSVAVLALPGTVAGLLMGIVSGVVGAFFGVVGTAIVAAIHRQVSGPSAEAVSANFE